MAENLQSERENSAKEISGATDGSVSPRSNKTRAVLRGSPAGSTIQMIRGHGSSKTPLSSLSILNSQNTPTKEKKSPAPFLRNLRKVKSSRGVRDHLKMKIKEEEKELDLSSRSTSKSITPRRLKENEEKLPIINLFERTTQEMDIRTRWEDDGRERKKVSVKVAEDMEDDKATRLVSFQTGYHPFL